MRLLSTRIHYQHRDDGTSTEMWTHQALATSASAEAAATTTGAVVADSRIFSEMFDATSEAALAAAATGAVEDAVVVFSLSVGYLFSLPTNPHDDQHCGWMASANTTFRMVYLGGPRLKSRTLPRALRSRRTS